MRSATPSSWNADRDLGRFYGVRKVHAQLRRDDGVDGMPVLHRQSSD